MSENQAAERLKVILQAQSQETKTSEHPLVVPGVMPPNQALQVLTLAQRTAEEHVAIAHRQADKIRTDAQASAEKIADDAREHSRDVRGQADQVLAEARRSAEKSAREIRQRNDEARRSADRIVTEARAQAQKITSAARDQAEQLRQQAQQRYEDVVGSLGTRREDLQRQIESLETFDRDYRARLTSFMQNQLRALWVDQPRVGQELPEGTAAATARPADEAHEAGQGAGEKHNGAPIDAARALTGGGSDGAHAAGGEEDESAETDADDARIPEQRADAATDSTSGKKN